MTNFEMKTRTTRADILLRYIRYHYKLNTENIESKTQNLRTNVFMERHNYKIIVQNNQFYELAIPNGHMLLKIPFSNKRLTLAM